MSEEQSLSKPQKPQDDLIKDPNQPGASDKKRKKSSRQRNKRINRLFTQLDSEIIDPNADTLTDNGQDQSFTHSPADPIETPTQSSPEPVDIETRPEPIAPGQEPSEVPIQNRSTESSIAEETQNIQEDPISRKKNGNNRAFSPRWSKSLGYQTTIPQDQQLPGDDSVIPTSTALTDFGLESLTSGEIVAGQIEDRAATLAYALPFGETRDQKVLSKEEQAALLLEIVDEDPARKWNEDELLLVEQVTDQLSLALENARLFEDARSRSEYLAVLNEMSEALSTQLNSEAVIETVYRYSTKLVDTTNFYLALYNEEDQEVTFPLAIEANERVFWDHRKIANGLTDHIFQSHQSLLISENVSAWVAENLQADLDVRPVQSWLGVPMIFSDQVIGVIAAQSFDTPNLYDENDLDLLNAVASQAAVALLNARLFEQTQSALSALEISERYQKSVAEAVAILTERGIAALSEVLELLGEASKASRAYYVETQVDGRGSYWRRIAEWHAPDAPSHLGNPSLRRLPTTFLEPWMEDFRADGYLMAVTDEMPQEQKEFMTTLGTRSMLQIAIAGRHEFPGCIGFEQSDYDRNWGDDEISALQTAASALSNTIAREDLFTQVQLNLAETEALYQASARLNSAASYDDILHVLRQHTILGHINAANVSLNIFEHPWEYSRVGELGERPGWMSPLARWSTNGSSSATSERYPLDSWPTIEALLQPEHPTMILDIESDARIDDVGRSIYLDQMGAKSLLYAPLNVAGQWIGHIVGVYRQTTGFPEQEIRRLTSLAGQAAIAVSGLLSLEEARQRNEDLATMNQITSAASETLDLDDMLGSIVDRLLKTTEFDCGLISVYNPNTQKLELATHINLPEKMVHKLSTQGLDNTPCDLVYRLSSTINISNLTNIPESNPDMIPWQELFDGPVNLGFQAYLGVPLNSKGKVLGTVCLFNYTPLEIETGGISVLQAVGQQLGVVIENAELFKETQNALSETEKLYEAGAELSAVQSYDDILTALRLHSILGEADTLAAIKLFNHPWTAEDTPDVVSPITQWTSLPQKTLSKRLVLKEYPAISSLSPEEPTIFEDITSDPRLDENTRNLFIQNYAAESTIFVPLTAGGVWIGYIIGAYSTTRQFSEGQIRRLVSLAGQATVALQNLRLLEESRRRANQLQTAAEIARDTSSTLTLEEMLGRAVNMLRDRFGYYHASIFLLDESENRAIIHESTGAAGAEMKRLNHSLLVGGQSIIGQVTATGEYMVINDVNQEAASDMHSPNPLLPDTSAELGIPLQIGGRVIGALDVQSTDAEAFTQDDIAVLQTLADQIAVAVDNARSYELSQQAMEEIREADRLKSQFLANMSHELRTPLNSIIGFSRVILKGIDGPINDLQQQDLNAIYSSGQHLLGLINDVLDLSKIEAGKMELSFEDNVILTDIIKGVLSTTAGLIKDKPIKLIEEIDPDLPPLRIDPMKVRQVLLNLLSNAAKFTEEGSITISAQVRRVKELQQEVLISVTDTGPGISPEDQMKLFQPFSQVDGSLTRSTGGSGLGLSICHHLIQMHGGRIGLRSKVDAGSTFYFSLPVDGVDIATVYGTRGLPELPDIQTADLPPLPELRPVDSDIQEEPTGDNTTDELNSKELLTSEELSEPSPVSDDSEVMVEKPNAEQVISNPITQQDLEPLANKLPLIELAQRDNNWPDPPTPLPGVGKGIVLAIESDHQVIDLYRRYLSIHAYSVVAVTELEQAVNAARGLHPIVITLDVAMKSETVTNAVRLNGWKILKQLKSDPVTKSIPVVICSLKDEREKAARLGADDYLVKPILEDDLAAAIERLNME